jgi:hypothetical protein
VWSELCNTEVEWGGTIANGRRINIFPYRIYYTLISVHDLLRFNELIYRSQPSQVLAYNFHKTVARGYRVFTRPRSLMAVLSRCPSNAAGAQASIENRNIMDVETRPACVLPKCPGALFGQRLGY